MIKYLELALSQEVYEYLEELDEMNWSIWGNVLNQYLRNTSIGTTVRVKAMLLAHCKLFYVKKFLITDYSKAFCNAILSGKIVTFLGVYFTRLCLSWLIWPARNSVCPSYNWPWPATLQPLFCGLSIAPHTRVLYFTYIVHKALFNF
jgi:hypothetical protein